LNYLKDLNLYSVCGLQTSSALIELFLKVLKLGRAACRGPGPNGLGTIKRLIICQGNATQAAVISAIHDRGLSPSDDIEADAIAIRASLGNHCST
jgi:hypothetical protein